MHAGGFSRAERWAPGRGLNPAHRHARPCPPLLPPPLPPALRLAERRTSGPRLGLCRAPLSQTFLLPGRTHPGVRTPVLGPRLQRRLTSGAVTPLLPRASPAASPARLGAGKRAPGPGRRARFGSAVGLGREAGCASGGTGARRGHRHKAAP